MKSPIVIQFKGPAIGERQWVTIALFGLDGLLLLMAARDPQLWEVEVFKVIIQAVTLTGLLNMVAAFHFASNKGSETARENTGAAFRAIEAAANAGANPATDAADGAQEATDAAQAVTDDLSDKSKGAKK